tara:strand:+ start:2053 stop:2685 length:633 start_codon:yes stop_codon:yes gene_type:complete
MSKTRQRTENKLLKAAEELLNLNGYKELDVKTITNLARVSYGTFYNYFSSIEEIHERIVKEKVSEVATQLRSSAKGIHSPLYRAFFGWYMSLKLFSNDPSAGWIVERPEVINDVWKNTAEEMQESLVIEAIKGGEIPGSEIDTLLHFRKARDTMRVGYVTVLEKIINGQTAEKAFYDYMTTLNLFNLEPKKVEAILHEVLNESAKLTQGV